jgi:hypothetical protein
MDAEFPEEEFDRLCTFELDPKMSASVEKSNDPVSVLHLRCGEQVWIHYRFKDSEGVLSGFERGRGGVSVICPYCDALLDQPSDAVRRMRREGLKWHKFECGECRKGLRVSVWELWDALGQAEWLQTDKGEMTLGVTVNGRKRSWFT